MRKSTLLSALLLSSSLGAMAQTLETRQYFFTSGGNWGATGNKVKIQYVKNGQVETIAAIPGDFANAVDIFHNKENKRYEGTAHVGRGNGNDVLIRYNLDTYQPIDSMHTAGITAIARNNNHLVIGKGYGAKGAKLEIRDAENLDSLFGITEITNFIKDVEILGDTAYIAHSLPTRKQSWVDSLGYLSIVHISQNRLIETIALGAAGKSINNLLVRAENDHNVHVYFTSAADVSLNRGNVVLRSKLAVQPLAFTEFNVFSVLRSGPGIIAMQSDLQLENEVGALTNIPGGSNYYHYDVVNNLFLVLISNDEATGKLIRYSLSEERAIDSVETGISSTSLAIDYRPAVTTGLLAAENTASQIRLFPAPCKDQLTIFNLEGVSSVEIKTLQGVSVSTASVSHTRQTISTEALPAGVYLLVAQKEASRQVIRFIKE